MPDFMSSVRARLRDWVASHGPDVHQVRGFAVVVENSRPDIETAAVLARLDESLALLERYAPVRVRHLHRDVRQFLVVRYPCRGAYLTDSGSIITELTFLARRDISPAVVASSILHEGVHARVARFRARMGESGLHPDRAREERLCRRAEVAFGQSLPAELGAPVVERAQASLVMDDVDVAPAIDWNVAQARIAAADEGRQP